METARYEAETGRYTSICPLMSLEHPHARNERVAPDPDDQGGRPLVLLVEDDAVMRAVVRQQLERGGYAVVESSSGREALTKLREGTSPGFLVTDLRMADGSGGWLVGMVGYEFPGLIARTVVISGDATSAAAAHVSARWRCPVLAKPFDGQQLVEALTQLARDAT